MAHTMELLLCCSTLHRQANLCCFCCPPLPLVAVDVSLHAVELPMSMRLLLLPPLLVVVLLPFLRGSACSS
jgi:hypothetical protein